MPQGVDLYIPFPTRISPDAEAAHARHLDWVDSFGLLATEEARDRHAHARYADLAARCQPRAIGDDLDVCVDQMNWYFVFDDSFDGSHGAPAAARKLVEAHVAMLDRPPGPDTEPIARAFADLWRRSQQGMSPAWRSRAANHWRAYLLAYLDEAANKHSTDDLSIEDCLRVRRSTIGVQPVLDLVERCGHFEMPERVLATEHLNVMIRTIEEIVIIQNDIYSVEKEEAIGDVHNTVLILQREHSCSRARAIDLAADLIRQRSANYLAFERQLPGLAHDLDLTPGEREAAERYDTDGMQAVARGNYDWSNLSARYAMAG